MSDDKALIPVEQKDVTFYEDTITAVRVNENVYIPLKPLCERLQVNWASQRQRINRDEVLSKKIQRVVVTTTHRGKQTMLCLPLDYVNGFLFGINASRVNPEIKDRLLRYQEDCYRVLADAFVHDKITHRPNPIIDELLNSDDPMVDTYKMLMAMANMAREQIILRRDVAALQTGQEALDQRVQLIEANLGDSSRYIDNSQAMQLSQAVKMVALELGKQTGGNEFQGVWGELHRRYQISSYLKLPAVRFDEAIGFLREWWESLTDGGTVPF